MDSNHRSVTQQIYSLSPLATREHAHILLLWLCEKLRSSQRLFIIAGRNEKCKPFFDFFKSFFQRKGKSNRNLKKNSIKREKAKIGLGAYGAVPVVLVQKAGAKRWLLGYFGYKKEPLPWIEPHPVKRTMK